MGGSNDLESPLPQPQSFCNWYKKKIHTLNFDCNWTGDPCMYITRFAHRMDFGEKTNEVCVAAMRLVSRMKRDWIHTGRRPSGLCGAALLVAARLHGFSCTLNDVVRVARIGHDTIRKRLTEFVSTPSSQLTINEFMSIDLESESDPPAFTEARLKQKQLNMECFEEEIGQLSNVIDNQLDNLSPRRAPPRTQTPLLMKSPLAIQESDDPDLKVAADFVHAENPDIIARRMSQNISKKEETSDKDVPGPSPSPFSLGIRQTEEECFKVPATPSDKSKNADNEGELELTGIDDEEIDQMLLNPNESLIKTRLWMAENGEFMKEMEIRAEKRRKEEEEREKTRPKKMKRKIASKKEYFANSQTAGEAIEKLLHRHKLSSKINYDALKRVNEEPSPQPVKSKPKFIDSFSNLAKYDMTPRVENLFDDDPQNVKVEDTSPIPKKKTKISAACLNPDVPDEAVKPEIITESGPIVKNEEVTVETGPVTIETGPIEDEVFDEYEEDESCLSASQLMQEAGVGDSGYGSYNCDEFDEYE